MSKKLTEIIHTRTHNKVPVAEGKLILLKIEGELQGLANQIATYKSVILDGIKYEPIIISEREKIEQGDKYFDTYEFPGQISECYFPKKAVGHKILVLPDQFSPKDLKRIADGKLNDGYKVLVECVDNTYFHEGTGKYWEDEPVKMKRILGRPDKYVELNPQGHVTLHKIVEKKYSKQDFVNYLQQFTEHAPLSWIINNLENGNNLEEWVERNGK